MNFMGFYKNCFLIFREKMEKIFPFLLNFFHLVVI